MGVAERIGLTDTIAALRSELAAAIAAAADEDVQFPVGHVELEFHVGVTKTADTRAGVKFWVVELGGGGQYAAESIQNVKVTLEPPVDRQGNPVKVTRDLDEKP